MRAGLYIREIIRVHMLPLGSVTNILRSTCKTIYILDSKSTHFKSSTLKNKIPNSGSKMHWNLNLIAAACENMGIGINGHLPWTLKKEMAFFTRMTSETVDKNKKNVVLMGRRTWECIPEKYRPLQGRINMVLTSQLLNYGDEAIVCKSVPHVLELISQPPLKDQVESVWVIGGSSVYKATMESPNFYRLYLTRVKKNIECDTFFPSIPKNFVLIKDPNIPQGVQEENGIEFEYEVYAKEMN